MAITFFFFHSKLPKHQAQKLQTFRWAAGQDLLHKESAYKPQIINIVRNSE